jgi:hypothetical protein
VRITSKIVVDISMGVILSHDYFEYFGPVDLAKGDSVAKNAEASQASFDSSLQNIFTAQYGAQSAITQYLTKQLEPNISAGGQGMSPQALAAARTQSTDTLSNQFQGAARAVNATEQRGLPSGVNAQVSGSLMAQQAEAQAQGQNQITMGNEQLKQANYWKSVNALSGNAAQMNPLGYANSSTSGSNSVSGLSQAVTQAQGPGLGAIFGSMVGGIIPGLGSASSPLNQSGNRTLNAIGGIL